MVTICNTGSLATAGYGTALGVVRSLQEMGKLESFTALDWRPLKLWRRRCRVGSLFMILPREPWCRWVYIGYFNFQDCTNRLERAQSWTCLIYSLLRFYNIDLLLIAIIRPKQSMPSWLVLIVSVPIEILPTRLEPTICPSLPPFTRSRSMWLLPLLPWILPCRAEIPSRLKSDPLRNWFRLPKHPSACPAGIQPLMSRPPYWDCHRKGSHWTGCGRKFWRQSVCVSSQSVALRQSACQFQFCWNCLFTDNLFCSPCETVKSMPHKEHRFCIVDSLLQSVLPYLLH